MDIGPVTRPVPSLSTAPTRADPQPVQGAVATELSSTQSVQSAGESEPTRLEISPQARSFQKADSALAEIIKRNTVFDQDANAVVFRSTDTRTGEVVQQIPDEALLKIRAYARAQLTAARQSGIEKIA